LAGLLLLMLPLLFRGRERAAASLLLAILCLPAVAKAQATGLPRSFLLERFQPQAGADDVLGVRSARVPQHLSSGASLYGSHANVPLRAVALEDSGLSRAVVRSQTTTTLVTAMGLFGFIELGAALPVTVSRVGGAGVVDPSLEDKSSWGGLADLRLSVKARVVERGSLGFAVALPVTLPTGREEAFMGGTSATLNPTAIAQWAGPRRSAVIVNGGFLFRSRQQLLNLTVGNAVTYGVGGTVDLSPRQKLAAQLNVAGEWSLEGGSAAHRPLEALAALRWMPWKRLAVTAGGGPGLTSGYGTPQFRLSMAVGWLSGDGGSPSDPR
jgi:hypothetical protein